MRHDFKVWVQANLACVGCILFIKLLAYVNPEIHESFNLWWTMVLPTLALIVAQPLKYLVEKEERERIDDAQNKEN